MIAALNALNEIQNESETENFKSQQSQQQQQQQHLHQENGKFCLSFNDIRALEHTHTDPHTDTHLTK